MALTLRSHGMIGNPFKTTGAKESDITKNALDYLRKEMLIDLREKQDASMAQAVAKPEDWIKHRKSAMKAVLEGVEYKDPNDGTRTIVTASGANLGELYTKFVDQYSADFPMDQALAMATAEVRPLVESRLRFLELQMPGASLMAPNLIAEKGLRDTKASLLAPAIAGEPITKAQYKEYRRARKAKKAAKK